VLFDVSGAKVRRRLDRTLAEFGFLAAQFSVRMAILTPGEVRRLKAFFRQIGSQEAYLILLPLGAHPPLASCWGQPLGASQLPWGQHPGHPPALYVAYPGEQPL
jgi:CRISPR/Cas system-associated endoribonuclease Cas2